jgi:hypothetical protein
MNRIRPHAHEIGETNMTQLHIVAFRFSERDAVDIVEVHRVSRIA